MRSFRIIASVTLAAAFLAALIWALLPKPVLVDLAEARRGPMEITVSAEGVTQVREKWAVNAPVTGNVQRSPVEVGDLVEKDTTVVAVIQPAEPAFLDARARRLAEVSVQEAAAAVQLAEAYLARSDAQLAHLEAELERSKVLAERGAVSQTMLEDAEQSVISARADRDVAYYELQQQKATKQRMEAQLAEPTMPGTETGSGDCCLALTAPQSGTVLEITDINARLVQAGTPLLTIGDLADLEIEVDLLSTDTVEIARGAPAYVERWGGDGVIDARVRRIDPSAYARVSALGIEEQRVRLLLDILSPADLRQGLGDQYRVFVRIITWSSDDVLQIPQSALFRHGDRWAVFVEQDGRARQRFVEIGHMSGEFAEVLAGVEAGEQVVAYPGAAIEDGGKIEPR
ncbi:efflux RND transporter periplasmic adaptor subunit, partial [Actibacterium sp.]|uniref:efflux RND transporter periplasmic adaptor subunit n=1 Tax=Actibacterium sp. TaxID=1872125 RepID=UPI003562E8FF